MIMEAAMLPIARTSSIEREPRTLNIDQIQCARDLAIYIMNTKSFEEASRIFTEGLQPVVSGGRSMGSSSCARMNMDSGEDLELELELDQLEPMNMKYAARETPAAAAAFKDIASAPF
ncbi:uncharacterized protein LOC130711745 [Lotus japonicus]|uniref:uncharacterized protein LOC130711745 n=1 Tax=Lotus japonicus TaxID=34305 RepID=UPI0025866D63|nr:uncharacterized protein LOC130711745 [Lotus japonicus]